MSRARRMRRPKRANPVWVGLMDQAPRISSGRRLAGVVEGRSIQHKPPSSVRTSAGLMPRADQNRKRAPRLPRETRLDRETERHLGCLKEGCDEMVHGGWSYCWSYGCDIMGVGYGTDRCRPIVRI